MLSFFADVTGILSFLLTLLLLIRSETLRKEVESQRTDYKKEQKAIKEKLIALRSNVIEDNILNQKIVSDIRAQLFAYQQKFKHLLNRKDKKHMKATIDLLEKDVDTINRSHLCKELDYFVARFERKEIR